MLLSEGAAGARLFPDCLLIPSKLALTVDQGIPFLALCGPLCWAAVFSWDGSCFLQKEWSKRGQRRNCRVFYNLTLKAYAIISTVSYWLYQSGGFPSGSVVKNLPAMQETQETWVQFLGWEDPLEGNGNPLQYSCLGNPIDRGAWWARVHGVTKELDMIEATKHVLIAQSSPVHDRKELHRGMNTSQGLRLLVAISWSGLHPTQGGLCIMMMNPRDLRLFALSSVVVF